MIRTLAALLADASTWSGGNAAALSSEYDGLNAQLEALYAEWEELGSHSPPTA